MRAARGVLLVLVGLACDRVAGSPTCPASLRQTADPLIVVVASTVGCEDGDRELGFIGDEAAHLAETLRRLSPAATVWELRNPDASCLEGAITRARGALTVIYTGHGAQREGRSGVCLRGGRWMSVESLVEKAEGAAYATFLINACRSAEIALHRANVVTIAASPDDVGNQHAETVVGGWLLDGFRRELARPGEVDLDRNGVVDSAELFALVDRAAGGNNPIMPKLQSQAWTRLPVITLDGGAVPRALPIWLQDREREFRAGKAAPSTDEPLTLWAISPDISGITPAHVAHVLPADAARAIAATSLAVLPIGVSAEQGELVARNLRTHELLWRREVAAGGALFRDADVDALLWGFEPLSDRRRYLRPLRRTDWDELDHLGWRPTSCLETTGQCFVLDRQRSASR